MIIDPGADGLPSRSSRSLARLVCSDSNRTDELQALLSSSVPVENGPPSANLADVDLIVVWEPLLQELCDAVHSLRVNGYVGAILAVGASDDSPSAVRALSAGADDYLADSRRTEELACRAGALVRYAARMRRHLHATRVSFPLVSVEAGSAGSVSTAAALSEGASATGASLAVKLTASEEMLLGYLMRRTGTWVSATELMERVFDYANRDDTTLVRVHVSSLRKKLGPLAVQLESRRSLGYRWR